jgi:iron complex outermembrane recepter protein
MQRRQRASMARSSGTAILGAALALPAGAVRADVLPVNEPLSASTGGGVMAAADEGAAETGLTDVVVTATRQSTILQRTPVAVTVVTSADIAEQNVTTTRDLAGLVPGVTIVRSGITPLTQVFFIRGIGESDPIFDPAIAQYVDDVYLPRAINGLSDLTDIERVEILRGPQGTLFGDNADAGAIRYITKDPTDTTQANFDVGGGNFAAFQTHAYLSGALVAGFLDGSIAFAHDQHAGYTYDPTIDQHVNDQNTDGMRVKLLAKFSENLSALLTLDGLRDDSSTDYYTPVRLIVGGTLAKPVYAQPNINDSYASQPPLNHSWADGVSLKITDVLDEHLTAKSITAARGFAQDPANYNNDGEPLVPYNANHPAPVSISDNYIVYHDKEWTQEFQLQGNYGKFDFTSGIFFLYENFSSSRIGYLVSPGGAGTPAYPFDQVGDTQTTSGAAYAQGDYHITDRFTATLGLRYTVEHRRFAFEGIDDTFAGITLPLTNPATAADFTYLGDKTWYSLTPKYGLQYEFTQDIFGYASVSKGFRAGGYNNRAVSLASALPYNEESVTTYETGLKTESWDHRIRANLTLFYNDYDNLQQTATVVSPVNNTPVSVRTNAGSAHTEGFELETVVTPVAGFEWRNNASYLSTRYTSFANAGGPGIDATGNQLPYSPHWQFSSQAAYQLPLAIIGSVRIGADFTYETSYFSDVLNRPQNIIAAQGYSDAFVSYTTADGHWTASLTGRNLADRRAFQSLTYAGSQNSWDGPVSPPRTVFVKLAYVL